MFRPSYTQELKNGEIRFLKTNGAFCSKTIDESKNETVDWEVSALGNYKSFLDLMQMKVNSISRFQTLRLMILFLVGVFETFAARISFGLV